ncbi:MAG: type II toxin-antitoxin system Phd/YefM family antitoxin [Hylemonella sp.]|nr:type II toxin-antitoxin system Phd/YefM family antitoxin [Hylemonella sp.]
MQTIASREAQSRFGATLDMAKGEPVTITQYGRPVVTMMSADLAEKAMSLYRAYDMAQFLCGLPPLADDVAMTQEESNALVHELR